MTTDPLATESDPTTEATLLDPVRVGDPASCGPFIQHYLAPLYHYLYWVTGSPDEAAVVFKDTTLYLYLNPSRVRKEASLRDWVYRHATQTWLQNRTHRQRQRRSSLANILRAGLETEHAEPWSTWRACCPGPDGDVENPPEGIIVALRALDERERAALLLRTVAGVSIPVVAASLRLSKRKAQRLTVSACGRAVRLATGRERKLPRGLRNAVGRHLLALDSPRQAKKFDAITAAREDIQQLATDGAEVLAAIQSLPAAQPPEGLAADTETHLAEGHAALETRIATWGFRFMQVTVPLFILAILTIMLLPAISRSRELARRAEAADTLRAIGGALQAYSDSAYGNRYPPLAPGADRWVPDLATLFPKHIQDPALLAGIARDDLEVANAMTAALAGSPPDWATAHEIFSRYYVYTGYTLVDAPALVAFAEYRQANPDFDREADVETAERRIFRLRQGVEQFFTGNAALHPGDEVTGPLRIPIMWEVFEPTGFGGNPEGANVLYLDGTVEYVPFGSAFPVDASVMAAMEDKGRER